MLISDHSNVNDMIHNAFYELNNEINSMRIILLMKSNDNKNVYNIIYKKCL